MSNSNEQWLQDTLKHIRILHRRLGGKKISVNDYLAYREECTSVRLPSTTTIYRLYNDFPSLLEAAGIAQDEKPTSTRIPDEELIKDLQFAAESLGQSVLSTHAYDLFRKRQVTRPVQKEDGTVVHHKLSSSSVIRKWLGPWHEAVARAGLETSGRISAQKLTLTQAIAAIREAKSRVNGRLTQAAYREFYESLSKEEKESMPDQMAILDLFITWEQALKAADVEQSDAIHPRALYTRREIRRIVTRCESLLRRIYNDPSYHLEEKGYEALRARSKRPLPEWSVVEDLMS
jgi:hypothetical protein